MTTPKPAPCPRHPDAGPYITGGLASKAVSCGNPGCWYGPRAGTEAEAIALWNAVVASDATRLAAVVKAAQDVAAESHPRLHLDALVALDKAISALTPDDLALLERWEEGK